MTVTSASFSYPTTSSDKRADLVQRLRRDAIPSATLILSTCLRLEVVVEGEVDRLAVALEELFTDPPDVASATVRQGEEATLHLFRIVAGLDSPVPGEREILAQFRAAVARAESSNALSGLFQKLLQEGIAAGRQARRILPTSPHASLADVAAASIGSVDRVAVLGSGTMSTAVVQSLRQLPVPPTVTLIARNPERVRLAGVEIWDFGRAAEALQEFPAIVSATSAKFRPVADDEVRAALAGRAEPGILIDMAMPPDFDLAENGRLRYIDIDDLARLVDARTRVDDAEELVRRAATGSHERFENHRSVAPVASALLEWCDTVSDGVTEQYRPKLDDPAAAEILRQATREVARKLAAGPLRYLRTEAEGGRRADIVAEMFDQR